MANEPETPDDENPLLAEAQARYEAAKQHASKWREQAKEDFRFYAGDQWDSVDLDKMREQQRPVVTFNRIMRLVNAVIGHEANNRAEVRYIPRTQGDAKVNELLTNAGDYFRDECDAEFEESDGFRDMIISGMGWTDTRLSDAENPDFDLIEERVDPMEMLWDAASKKPNLADARYMFRRKRYTEKEVKTIWPEFEGPFLSAFGDENEEEGEPIDRSPRMQYRGGGGADSKDVKPDILVVEYQYRERQSFYVITSQQTGENIEIPVDDMTDDLKGKLKERTELQMAIKRRTITRRCFIIGNKIVQGPDIVCPHGFTYNCITGFRDREKGHWFGIVRMLKDPQRWSNKWLAQIMHIVNTNAKGGVMMEETAVADMNAFNASWADPGANTVFADGALKDGRVQPKPMPVYPQGVDRLLEYANASFTDVSGVNQELLGLADREQAGVLEWQRKQSAVTLLAPLFDSLRRFRKMQGRVWLYMMQKYVSDGRLIRITADQGDQYVQFQPQWSNPDTATYDVVVDQAASAPNVKEQTWAVFSQLFPFLKDVLPPQMMLTILEYSPLPESVVTKLRQQVQEMQQQGPPPDPEMVKAENQAKAKQAELQMKQQEMQMTAQFEQQKAQAEMEMEAAKARNEIEIERFKAEQTAMLEREKANTQMGLEQQKMGMERERANFDAALDSERMSREGQMAQHKMSLDTEAHGLKMETANGKTGKGPFTSILETIADRNEKGFSAILDSNKGNAAALEKLASILKADSDTRGAAIKEIISRRQRRGASA